MKVYKFGIKVQKFNLAQKSLPKIHSNLLHTGMCMHIPVAAGLQVIVTCAKCL